MPNLAVNDIIEVKARGTLFAQQMLNVFHFRLSVIPTSPDYQTGMVDLLSAIDGSMFQTKFLACCPNEYTLQDWTVQRVSPAREIYYRKFEGVIGTGGAGNPAQDVNAVLTFRSEHVNNHTPGVFTNEGGTGGCHFPGIPSSSAVGGLITAGYATTVGAFGDQLLIGFAPTLGGVYLPCIWNRKATGQPKSKDVIQTVVQPEVRVMRRRTVGRGI